MDESDLTANTAGTIVMDQNGQKCALIKVETTQTGFSFDAGSLGVVKTEQKVGEIWVYVPEGVKRLSISHQQLGVLRDYDLGQTLRRAKTYILKLNAVTQPGIKTQKVTINYTPANAMVLVDSKPYKGNGHIETELPVESHNYIIAAEGYETIEGSFKLTESAPRTITEHLVATEYEIADVISIETQGHDTTNGFSDVNSVEFQNSDIDILGIEFRPVTDKQKEQLEIAYGIEILKVNKGKMKEAGVPKGFIIQRVNDNPMRSVDDFLNVIKESKESKNKILVIRGIFPTGKRGGFVINL